MVAGENKSEMQLDFRRQEDKNSFSVTWNNYDHFIAFSTIKHCRIYFCFCGNYKKNIADSHFTTYWISQLNVTFFVNVSTQINVTIIETSTAIFNFVFLKAPFIIHNLEKLSRHVDTDRPAATGVPSPSSATLSRMS